MLQPYSAEGLNRSNMVADQSSHLCRMRQGSHGTSPLHGHEPQMGSDLSPGGSHLSPARPSSCTFMATAAASGIDACAPPRWPRVAAAY
jgi:hypothetical protein